MDTPEKAFRKRANMIQLIRIFQLVSLFSIVSITNAAASDDKIVDDIGIISKYWGNVKPYSNNPANLFGVKDTGLPPGCQVEQVQVLHRHAARYPSHIENAVISQLATKLASRALSESFKGPLSFLNTWTLQLGEDLLLKDGFRMAYQSGTDFWNQYGRLLYNATPGQNSYNEIGEKKPLIRCNKIPRVFDTANAWSEGFFGQYNATSKYSLLAIPYILGQNNTLASFVSCLNFLPPTSILGRVAPSLFTIVPLYLQDATHRLSQYAPPSVNFTTLDVWSMQALCTYEHIGLGSSEFCSLFTLREWKGYEYVADSFIYNYASFGSPAGRALGLGILQEILARLKQENIFSSSSSINSTLDSALDTFPLDQKFYADFTHDFIIAAVMATMSLDYFRKPLPITYPPPANVRFRSSTMTPYAARLLTEKIGCTSANPEAKKNFVTQYSNSQNGYSPSTASFKFVRMRLNNAILPLRTIRGGGCRIRGRTDGLCPLNKFLASQAKAEELANYQFTCFGNYTYNSTYFTGDGNYFPQQ